MIDLKKRWFVAAVVSRWRGNVNDVTIIHHKLDGYESEYAARGAVDEMIQRDYPGQSHFIGSVRNAMEGIDE